MKYREIKMPIIADEVKEEWLEKKMLCFLRRLRVISPGMKDFFYIRETCCNELCQLCFPTDHIPDVSAMVENGNVEKYCFECGSIMRKTDKMLLSCPPRPIYVCPDCENEVSCKENDHSEDVREKVTVEWILEKINYLANCNYTRGKYDFEKISISEAKEEQFNELKQKLEYLVSLQGK